ncbi:Baculoviral IAP repeat-containing protein 7-A [Bulinus truncatus]|nr:Baculoviral IAP repeat-containing protein 7-A [Bulinus truncatus]
MGVFQLIVLQVVSFLTYSATDNFKKGGKGLQLRKKKTKKLQNDTKCNTSQKGLNQDKKDVTNKSNEHFRIKPQTIDVYHLTRHGESDLQPDLLKHEINRLGTFAKYPASAPKSAVLLAESGFVYTGGGQNEDDTVTCVFCQGVKKSWRTEDNVDEIHRTVSPNCPLMRGLICGNVPIALSCSPSANFLELLEKLRIKETLPLNSARNTSNDRTQPLSTVDVSSPVRLETGGNERSVEQHLTITTETENPANLPLGDTDVSTINGEIANNSSSNTPHANSATVDVNSINSEILNNSSSNTPHANSATVGANSHRPAEISNTTNQNTRNLNTATQNTSNINTANQNTSSNANGPTYSELGIVTDRPKRSEYALRSERLKTFSSWPRGHHIQPTVLADAGFYFAGYGDCARCFYCGGGLRNWEDDDDVWVEHARWFSRCSFIRQRLGQIFVDTVQELNKTLDKIPYSAVMNKIGAFAATYQLDVKDDSLKKDPAVKSVVELGIPQNIALEMAKIIKGEDSVLSSDKLLLRIKEERPEQVQIPEHLVQQIESLGSDRDSEKINSLKENNNILRQQTVCKICMDKEVEIVFLPCGHLVSCAECASAMKDCPVCRKHVKGTVRAFIS